MFLSDSVFIPKSLSWSAAGMNTHLSIAFEILRGVSGSTDRAFLDLPNPIFFYCWNNQKQLIAVKTCQYHGRVER